MAAVRVTVEVDKKLIQRPEGNLLWRVSSTKCWTLPTDKRQELAQLLDRTTLARHHQRFAPRRRPARILRGLERSSSMQTSRRGFESGHSFTELWPRTLGCSESSITCPWMISPLPRCSRSTGRALAILHDVPRLSDGTGLVFRSLRGKPLSTVTLSKLTKELGIAAVPHGFRSSFRDWAAERTNTPREVVEAALAHTVQNPTEAAYARSDLFERRRRLMDDWANYLNGTRGQVIPLRR